jgi:hypothetical protein
MGMKMASMKKEKPSIANPSPKTLPKVAVRFGQRSPNSKERMVPVTTPTAKRIIITFDQRFVGGHASTKPEPLREENHRGEGNPEADQWDVDDEGHRLHLPSSQQVGLRSRT